MTLSPAKARNDGSTWASVGAAATIWLVIPVSTAIKGGIAVRGFTRVWNSPSTSPPRTLTAPNSVIVSSTAPPVVSRSTTQNVTCDSWVPRSSNDDCAGEDAMCRTVRRCSDSSRLRRRLGVSSVRDRILQRPQHLAELRQQAAELARHVHLVGAGPQRDLLLRHPEVEPVAEHLPLLGGELRHQRVDDQFG